MREYYEKGRHYVSMAPEGVMLCDFCSEINEPMKPYPARDIEIVPGKNSEGGWLACALCADLIDQNNYGLLIARMVRIIGAKVPAGEAVCRLMVQKFNEARL